MENPAPLFRTYRLKLWQRVLSLLFFAVGAALLTLVWIRPVAGQEGNRPMVLLFCSVFFLAGFLHAVNNIKPAVSFTSDAIEVRTTFGRKSLPLSEIRGRREYLVRGNKQSLTRYLKLEAKDELLPALHFVKNFDFDDAFFQWFYGLADLDAEDKKTHPDSAFNL